MNTETYYPPPESKGGWRWLKDPQNIQNLAGMESDLLDQVQEQQEFNYSSDSWGVVVIRHGYLVKEFYTFNILPLTRYDLWTGTTTFTATAWGMLLEDYQQVKMQSDTQFNLDSPAHSFIPEAYPLSDHRKEQITIRHFLTMTSGIPGESRNIYGLPTNQEDGPFEHALGFCANRHGKYIDRLIGEPGEVWDFSDPGTAHLALAFKNITDCEINEYLQERIFTPIGIECLSWDFQGGGNHIGPHTKAYSGAHISARELARFGYLMLHKGAWNGEQLIPEGWVNLATTSSQELNSFYGYGWWVNTNRKKWPGLPEDAFAMLGYRTNGCYIIPSLDLVVARVGSGPSTWNDQWLIGRIAAAIQPDSK